MFDSQGDAMSVSSRMPSMVAHDGASMQEHYLAQQAGSPVNVLQPSADVRNGNVNGQTLARRKSSSSIISISVGFIPVDQNRSDTERMHGWSGSKGGIENEAAMPKFRVSSSGKLVLAPHLVNAGKDNTNSKASGSGARPVLKSHKSEGGKPMYRPAFAPSTELPPSEDEEDLDKVIQHDLPSVRTLKPRPSLKQKLGSFMARVGSVRKRDQSPSPPLPSPSARMEQLALHEDAVEPKRFSLVDPSPAEKVSTRASEAEDDTGADDYITVKRASVRRSAGSRSQPSSTPKLSAQPTLGVDSGLVGSSPLQKAATSTGTPESPRRPEFSRSRSTRGGKRPARAVTAGVNGEDGPAVAFDEDDIIRSSDGGVYAGGFAGLARRLSRRATTGGRPRRAEMPQETPEQAALTDKAEAEAMLRAMADIPLHKPPRSAHVPNARPLSSFAPRAPLKTSTDTGSLANSPRYSYYQRQLKDFDGPNANKLDRQVFLGASTGSGELNRTRPSNAANGKASRHRENSSPSMSSMASTAPLLAHSATPATSDVIKEEDSSVPPVPPLPIMLKDGISDQGSGQASWEKFGKVNESSFSIADKKVATAERPDAIGDRDRKANTIAK